jgi:hypothetical protein
MHFISCFFDLTDADDDDDDDNESKMSAVAAVPKCDLQPPFQPSSTPVHLQHRFMVSVIMGVINVITVQIVAG